MAELNYGQLGDAQAGAWLPEFRQVVNILGAFISLGLIAGLVWWGYQLVVRDVSGVPVVRALEGPMRVAPSEPGGELAEHTGLAVNTIPAQGIAEAPADRLVLAPQQFVLADEDKAASVLSEIAPAVGVQNPDGFAFTTEPTARPTATVVADAASTPVGFETLITAALAEATGLASDGQGTDVELVSADLGGVTKSLVPIARPATLADIKPPPVAEDGFVIISPADIAEGTRLAQLGAFDSASAAMAEWAKLTAQYPEFLTDKARVIEPAQSGGKLFFRLRAHGFEDLADARRFCAALVAGQANCIPVRQR